MNTMLPPLERVPVGPSLPTRASSKSPIKTTSTDEEKFVIASENLKVLKPWQVKKSNNYEDRYFFFNDVSKESRWEIEKEFIVVVSTSTEQPQEPQEPQEGPPDIVDIAPTVASNLTPITLRNNKDTVDDDDDVFPAKDRSPVDLFPSLSSGRSAQDLVKKPQNPPVTNMKANRFGGSNSRSPSNIRSRSTSPSNNGFRQLSDSLTSSFSFPTLSNTAFWKTQSSSPPITDDKSSVASGSRTKPTSRVAGASMSQDIMGSIKNSFDAVTAARSKSADHGGVKSKTLLKKKPSPSDQPVDPLFRVVDALSMGGFSIVVKVEDTKTRKTYAMKKIYKSKYSSWPDLKQLNFELEATLAMSSSPFMVPTRYIYEDVKFVYTFSDLMCGDLWFHIAVRKYLASKHTSSTTADSESKLSPPPFSEDECMILLAELYLAVEHLHKHGLVHRDIRVENIMIDFQGHVKLTDLGLVLGLQGDETQPMIFSRNIATIPPEGLTSKTGGKHTDWWAYGVVAYELLVGQSPWSSLQDVAIITNEILSKPIEFPNFLSSEARELLGGLLQRDYKKRLGTDIRKKAFDQKEADDSLVTTKNLSITQCSFFRSVDWNMFVQCINEPAFKPPQFQVSDNDRKVIREEMLKHGKVQGEEKPDTITEEEDGELEDGRQDAKEAKLQYPDIALVMVGSY